jgi:hypothetical protein
MAMVQSEETGNWGAEPITVEFEIPVLQLASFAADPNGK